MNILMLGANGYLGSKLTHALLQENHTIVCCKRPKSNLTRLEDIKDRLIFIPASLDAIDVISSCTSMRFDWVINMACNYGRSDSLYDNVIEANIAFPLNVLNKMVAQGTRNFLTIGTGLPDDLNMYSFSKKMFSDFGNFYVQKHQINFFTLKLEMFYGSDEPTDRFLPSTILGMLEGRDINVTMGTQHRDIIAAEDVIQGILNVLHSDLPSATGGYWEIPVGTGIAPTISEVIDYLWEKTGKKSKVNKGAIPQRKNEPDCVADNSMLLSIGPWSPAFWKDGLEQMIIQLRDTYGKE